MRLRGHILARPCAMVVCGHPSLLLLLQQRYRVSRGWVKSHMVHGLHNSCLQSPPAAPKQNLSASTTADMSAVPGDHALWWGQGEEHSSKRNWVQLQQQETSHQHRANQAKQQVRSPFHCNTSHARCCDCLNTGCMLCGAFLRRSRSHAQLHAHIQAIAVGVY